MQFGNEEVVITIFIGTALTLFFALIIVFLFILFNNKNKLNIKEREVTKKAFEETLLRSQLEIKEQTLRHIAYELHDNLGQVASLIKINLNTLQLNDQQKAREKIEGTKDLVRQLITDLKLLSVSLNSDRIAQQGIVSVLQIEVERLNKTGQFEAVLNVSGAPPELENHYAIILYRMAQEIINNMVKHSAAKRITISITNSGKLVILVCTDDGVGFNLEDKMRSGGSGLTNLHSRAALIHANLTIQSAPGKGTTIAIELPI